MDLPVVRFTYLAVVAHFGEFKGYVRLAGFEGVAKTRHDLVGAFGRPEYVDDLDKVTADQLADVAEGWTSCPAHQPDAQFRVHQVHPDRRGIKEGFEPGVAVAQLHG